MKLQADEAKKLVASIVAGIPDLTHPRAASLFYEILILSSGGAESWYDSDFIGFLP